MKLIIFFALFVFVIYSNVNAQKQFIEQNSRVIVELENNTLTGWQTAHTTVGTKTIQYIYSTTESLKATGLGKLTYKVKITNPGTYRFVWHCKVGQGTSTTDHNDTWLRIPDASSFYAVNSKNGKVVRPHGICTTDCPNGVGSDGWFKVYSNGTSSWTWNTYTSDKDASAIFATFSTAGTYTVEISIRSNYQFLDRFVMFNETVNSLAASTDLSLPESATETITGGVIIEKYLYNAKSDFSNIYAGEVPFYVDNVRNALAINAAVVNFRDKKAKATTPFTGNDGIYDIELTTLAEFDGECTYRFYINGGLIGTYQNPRVDVANDYQLQKKVFANISVKKGDIIAVETQPHTNLLIPEGTGTAWARGRWRSVEFKSPNK